MTALGRSPTFLVGGERQRVILDEFKREDQHLSEQYQKNKPLCFNARAYQRTHARKMVQGKKDADATLSSPMMLGVADGVSQIEDFGIDASELPNELLRACEELALAQLIPDTYATPHDSYSGPIALMRDAYDATESLGSTTALLALMDNSTRIHGKLHPMIAILSIGDCELLILRRLQGKQSPFEAVFHTEMQRIDGHAQQPLQIARVDDRVDPEFDEGIAIEVIERGSAVHYVSAYEGDIVVLGSDGVYDNLFLDEIVHYVNQMLPVQPPGKAFGPTDPALLGRIARRVVEESHHKTDSGPNGYPDTPIGKGGKVDDTCFVVGEVIEWTKEHSDKAANAARRRQWEDLVTCGGNLQTCSEEQDDDDDYDVASNRPSRRAREYNGPSAHGDDDEEEDHMCCIL